MKRSGRRAGAANRGTPDYVERFPGEPITPPSPLRAVTRVLRSRWMVLAIGLLAGGLTMFALRSPNASAVGHCPDHQAELEAIAAELGLSVDTLSAHSVDAPSADPAAAPTAARPPARRGAAKEEDREDADPPDAIESVAIGPRSTLLRIPVRGLTREDLIDTYEDPRSGDRTHEAIDLMAPRGTEVLAAASGTVEKLFQSRLGGKTIYIRLPSGFIHYYAHLERYERGLTEGQEVEAGDVIGRVGSTGNASADAPHLHFAIYQASDDDGWWQGEAVNPFPLLSQTDT